MKSLSKMQAVVTATVLSLFATSAMAQPDISAFTAIGGDITATATTLFATFAGVAAGVWILYYVFSIGRKMASKAT